MNTMKRSPVQMFLSVVMLLGGLMLGSALMAPKAVGADNDNNHKKQQSKRYYDKKNHDYHQWNDSEDHAYRTYLQENHRDYRDFNKVKAPEQQQYFQWRHDHPDSALLNIEIR